MVRISEIFGPVIQGEGAHIGEPTVFVRSGGCDYRCSWCDTLYAVDPKFKAEWHEMNDDDLCDAVRKCSKKPLLVTLSGGNPALFDFSGLINRLQSIGYRFTIETQGSVPRSWFALLDSMTLSPKPPSSGMLTDFEALTKCTKMLPAHKQNLKIVVADGVDYEYARHIAGRYPFIKTFLQVCNPDPTALLNRDLLLTKLQWLTERVLADRWFNVTVLPQLHVLIYGNKRGV
jgi:7-carboxy-7-deazaguanine synthase